jgi:LAO/AO transport system kinase
VNEPAWDQPAALAAAVRQGQRRALAQAITLVESTRPEHRRQAEALLAAVLTDGGQAMRLGITGVPGAGKSTLIETFGLRLLEQGHRVAVLAVDPSSPRSGGSLLGDKTRMDLLSRDQRAFIRPTPTAGSLGGVARRTREAMALCEAAGFDIIIVETVGVGQSEMAVADMVDMFLLLLLPAGGDELQGLKKGIVEMADAVIVNKADGDWLAAAQRTQQDYRNALHLLRRQGDDWTVPVLCCSALAGTGLEALQQTILEYRRQAEDSGAWTRRRAEQALRWMWQDVSDELLARLRRHPGVARERARLEVEVAAGRLLPATAAAALLKDFLGAGVND